MESVIRRLFPIYRNTQDLFSPCCRMHGISDATNEVHVCQNPGSLHSSSYQYENYYGTSKV